MMKKKISVNKRTNSHVLKLEQSIDVGRRRKNLYATATSTFSANGYNLAEQTEIIKNIKTANQVFKEEGIKKRKYFAKRFFIFCESRRVTLKV